MTEEFLSVMRALHAVDCYDAEEECRREGWKIPEKWADPFLPSAKRQFDILERRTKVLINALEGGNQ
jgi:hypothetical protein